MNRSLRPGRVVRRLSASLLAAGFILAPTTHAQDRLAQAAFAQDAVESVTWNIERDVPLFLAGSLRAPDGKRPADLAATFFSANAAVFGLDVADDFVVQETETDDFGLTHIRVQQTVHGVPVFGAESALHLNSAGAVYAFGGDVHPEAKVIDTNAALAADAAILAAQSALGAGVVYRQENTTTSDVFGHEATDWTPTANLVVFPQDGRYTLAYHVELFVDEPAPANWNVFVDARTGAIVHRFNAIHTAHSETVAGPTTGSGTSTFGGTLTIPTYLSGSNYYLYDTTRGPQYIRTMTANNGTGLPGSYITDTNNSFTSSAQKAGVDAHFGAVSVYDYYSNTFGRNSWNGSGGTITSTVHYASNYNNAFWNGGQMVYGDGDGSQFIPLVSLDIVAHELTHAVTQDEAGLIYQDESGALNEAVSDIFAIMVDRDDWKVGELSYTPGIAGDALRYMDDPTLGNQPDRYADRYTGSGDNGGVHINSGIINKAAYLMIKGGTHYGVSVTGIGRSKVEAIWYRALTVYFTASTNFAGARAGTLQAAADLYGNGTTEYNSVANAWASVGVGSTSGGGTGGTPQWYYEANTYNTPHNYPNNYNASHTYSKPGAQQVAMYFGTFNTEANYDFVYVKDQYGATQATYHGNLSPFWAVVAGSSITANLVTDYSVTRYGYQVTQVAYYSPNPLLVQGEEGMPLAEPPVQLPEPAIESTAKADDDAVLALNQAHPNPFNPSTVLSFSLPDAMDVTLTVFDVLGREVAVLVNERLEAGAHEARFDASLLPSGTYLYTLDTGAERLMGRMLLVK